MGDTGILYAGGGPAVGSQVPQFMDPPTNADIFLCLWHMAHPDVTKPHPDDVAAPEPETPREPVRYGLDTLDPKRQWRVIASDPLLINITDGVNTTMAYTRDYVEHLRRNGSLPGAGQSL